MKIKKKDLIKLSNFLQDKLNEYSELYEEEFIDISNNVNILELKEKQFVLPEKWGFKARTEKNAKYIYPIINREFGHEWSVKNIDQYLLFQGKFSKNTCNFPQNFDTEIPEDYTEILAEDLIDHVIKGSIYDPDNPF